MITFGNKILYYEKNDWKIKDRDESSRIEYDNSYKEVGREFRGVVFGNDLIGIKYDDEKGIFLNMSGDLINLTPIRMYEARSAVAFGGGDYLCHNGLTFSAFKGGITIDKTQRRKRPLFVSNGTVDINYVGPIYLDGDIGFKYCCFECVWIKGDSLKFTGLNYSIQYLFTR